MPPHQIKARGRRVIKPWLSAPGQGGWRPGQPAVHAARLLALSAYLCRLSKGETGTLSLPVKLQDQGVGVGRDEHFQTRAVLNTVFPITGKESSLLFKMITMEHLPFLFHSSNLRFSRQPPFHNDS